MAIHAGPTNHPKTAAFGRRSLLVGDVLVVAGCTRAETRPARRRLLSSSAPQLARPPALEVGRPPGRTRSPRTA
jgi:hypothetical protein